MNFYCLHQRLTHNADRKFIWTVAKIESPGAKPVPMGVHDEPPLELAEWARHLNEANVQVGFDFGVTDRAAVVNTLCPIDRDECVPMDGRGRWLCATGFGNGSHRPCGLGLAASHRHCPALAGMLDAHFGTDTRPAPPAPPAKPRELTTAEKVEAARGQIYDGLANGFARSFSRSESDTLNARSVLSAIEKLIDARFAIAK